LNRVELKIRPSVISKITTCLQFISVIAVLSRNHVTLPPWSTLCLLYTTGLFTISSGLHYIHYWFRFMGENAGERKENRVERGTR
jgi:phosphatidylglycerophosphate synthase